MLSPHEIATAGSTNLTINLSGDIDVPNTGVVFSGGISVLQSSLLILGFGALIAAIFLAKFLYQKYYQRNFIKRLRVSPVLDNLPKVMFFTGIFAFGFLLINLILPNLTSNEKVSATETTNEESLAITTLGEIEANASISNEGALASVADTVLVSSATKHGYSLYVSSGNESNNLYLDGDSSSEKYLKPTEGTGALTDNSWGYTMDLESNQWDMVPAAGEEKLIKNIEEATLADDATKVYYGAKANSDATPGAYKGTLVYTAIANYIPYALTINAADNTTVTVTRTESPIGGGEIGQLENGEAIFENDVLKIEGKSNTGYKDTILSVNGQTFTSGNSITVEDSVEVTTSSVERQTFAVNYDCNSGSGTVSSQTKIYGIDLTLSNGATCSNVGYRLAKWNTQSDGSGTSYELMGVYSGNAPLNLYAIWEVQDYTLTTNFGTGAKAAINRTASIHGGAIGLLADGATIYYGDTLEITYGANDGYNLDEHKINNESVILDSENKIVYTVLGNTTVSATAKPIERTLSLTNDGFSKVTANRTSSPISGSTGSLGNNAKIYYNDVIEFTFAPNPGYSLDVQKINGNVITPDASGKYSYTVGLKQDVEAYSSAFIEYQVVYTDISGEAQNMPSTQTSGHITDATYAVTLQSTTIPYRENYSFRGWSSSTSGLAIDAYSPNKAINFVLNTTSGQTSITETGETLTSGSTLTLYAVWEATTNFSSSVTTMQDFDASICSAASTPTKWDISASTVDGKPNTSIIYGVPAKTLTDTRDGKTYTVAKLADGNCWMTQNLGLERTADFTTLTSSDSNVSSNFELPVSQTSGSESWGDDDRAMVDIDTPHLYSTGNSNYGNFYNYYVATAGTGGYSLTSGTASSSVCPKNWTLPTSTRKGYFNKLISNTYGIKTNADTTATDRNKLLSTPFFYVAAGHYNNGHEMAGATARYWSSTAMSAIDSYYFTMSTEEGGQINPSNYWRKYYGEAIRCMVATN